jgi:response regulator RpfG family c-di-GMP phosphodiesterase
LYPNQISSAAEKKPPRLLFVDDEPNVLRSLRRIFLDEDFDIALMESGEEALEFLKDHPVDLILSDHNMPGMSGVEFLSRAKDVQPDCIRMLITGRGDLQVALDAINRGNIYKFFQKPWEDHTLRIAVLRALEYREAQQRMRHQERALERFTSYRQTMVTVSHYINNFNCSLIISLESLQESQDLQGRGRDLVDAALVSAHKINEVLRILNQLQDLKITAYPSTEGMIDIEAEMRAAVEKIEREVGGLE